MNALPLTRQRQLPAQHPSASGHFPGNPLVPGSLLLNEVLDAADEALGTARARWRIEQAKFIAPIRYGSTFTLSLQAAAAGKASGHAARIDFKLHVGEQLAASGRLSLDLPGEPA